MALEARADNGGGFGGLGPPVTSVAPFDPWRLLRNILVKTVILFENHIYIFF